MGSKHIQNILLPLTQALGICKEILCLSPVQSCSKTVNTEGFPGVRVLLGRSVLAISITLQALLIALAGGDTWYKTAREGRKKGAVNNGLNGFHRIHRLERTSEVVRSEPPAQGGPPRAGCPGPSPDGFYPSPRTPQPPWAI